ncbi:MAG: DUF86 domain-containing protein [Bacteroidetes bacterium]|nr:DUF86 domain-containing protein [Bacteroidota bacterium]
MKYNGIIEDKLRIIERKLEEIRSWKIDSFEDFQQSTLLQNAAERALQVAIEVMIDISERILSLKKIPPRNTAAENITQLQKLNIIKSVPEYSDMIKFRNFIVHRYEKIDLEIVYAILKNKLFLFESFIEDIRNS